MKKRTGILYLTVAAVAVACASQAASSGVYSNGFDSGYTAGALTGQDSWASYLSGTVQVTNGVGVNTSQVLGKSTSATTAGGASQAVILGLGAYNTGTFSVDFYRNAGGTTTHTMYAGFGSSANSSSGMAVMATSANISYRPGVSAGTTVLMFEAAGDSTITAIGAWERLTMNLDFQNNQITSVYIQNMTTLAPARQLFFDNAATVATQTYLVDETSWNTAYIRTGKSTDNPHFIDNMSLTGPERKISLFVVH